MHRRTFRVFIVVAIACAPHTTPPPADPIVRTIVTGIGSAWGSRLSPDGRTIAFTLRVGTNDAIHVADVRSGAIRRLTDTTYRSFRPAWSPDGRRIAFAASRGARPDIYVMNADGSNHVRLTSDTTVESDPAWSPDGGWIAYGSNRGGKFDIWVSPAGGGEPLRLTNSEGRARGERAAAWAVGWAPDSRHITFVANWDTVGRANVWRGPVSGGEPVQLTRDRGGASQPAWSPDGRWIAITSDRGGQYDLWLVPAQGGELVQLTDDDLVEDFPTWSRDGRLLAYDTGGSSARLRQGDRSPLGAPREIRILNVRGAASRAR